MVINNHIRTIHLYYGSTSPDRYWIDPEIGTDRGFVSTRPTRIRTDFWIDVGTERNASESGPFRSVPFRSDISFQWNHLVRKLL